MYSIGSGDIKMLMTKNKETKTYKSFLAKFFGIEQIKYNALASPIDQLRTGAILEQMYYRTLSIVWGAQEKVQCKELPVLTVSLDFALVENSKVIEFEELKTIDFFKLMDMQSECIDCNYIKKKHKDYYYQIQSQLLATDLKNATLTFLAVYTYDDIKNKTREVKENELMKIKIPRDEEVIDEVKKALIIFQQIKEYMECNQ